jgi:hypothetical protein
MNLDDKGILLRNNKGNENNWLQINLIGTTSNRDGVGTRVKLFAGGKEQTTQKKSASGYLSQNDPRLHFGLGSTKVVDKLVVTWPSGKVQTLENIESGNFAKEWERKSSKLKFKFLKFFATRTRINKLEKKARKNLKLKDYDIFEEEPAIEDTEEMKKIQQELKEFEDFYQEY